MKDKYHISKKKVNKIWTKIKLNVGFCLDDFLIVMIGSYNLNYINEPCFEGMPTKLGLNPVLKVCFTHVT